MASMPAPTWLRLGQRTARQWFGKRMWARDSSGPAVAEGRLIVFQRLENEEVIACLDAATGQPKWKYSYPTSYRDDFGFDEGPRATPCLTNGRVYTFGAEGMLTCLNKADGSLLWQVNTKKDFHPRKGFFGVGCSPLVENNAVLLNVGGAGGAGLAAFDAATGQVRWKTTDNEASYSSPVAAVVRQRRYVFFFTRTGLQVVDPLNGTIQNHFTWRSTMNASVNAATPLVIDDTVFLSACYGTGAILLRLQDKGLETVWSGDNILSNHYATSVYDRGFIYGSMAGPIRASVPRPVCAVSS